MEQYNTLLKCARLIEDRAQSRELHLLHYCLSLMKEETSFKYILIFITLIRIGFLFFLSCWNLIYWLTEKINHLSTNVFNHLNLQASTFTGNLYPKITHWETVFYPLLHGSCNHLHIICSSSHLLFNSIYYFMHKGFFLLARKQSIAEAQRDLEEDDQDVPEISRFLTYLNFYSFLQDWVT